MSHRHSAQDFAALHARMERQRDIRQFAGRGLRTGDLVQARGGGEIREVVEHESAGMYFRRMAEERALEARTERRGNN